MPVNFGVQYRIFEDVIADNLRPYISAGVGPSLIITTPYELEFLIHLEKHKLNMPLEDISDLAEILD